MAIWWLAILIAGTLGMAACAGSGLRVPSTAGGGDGFVDLRRPLDSRFLVLKSLVNDSDEVLSLLVDTGSEVTGIELEAARFMVIRGRDDVTIHGLHGSQLDSLLMHGQFRPAVDRPAWAARPVDQTLVLFPASLSLPYGVQGIVGLDYLERWPMIFDVAGGRIAPANPTLSAGLARQGSDWVRLDLLRPPATTRGLRFITCDYQGERLIWLVDSGADQSLLSSVAAARIGLDASGRQSAMADAGGHQATMVRGTLRNTLWGDSGGSRSIAKIEVGVTDLPKLANQGLPDGRPVDGLLGIDFLRRHDAVIDFSARCVWLRP